MIDAIVTVRTKSTRLPNKCLLGLTPSRNVVKHVLLRCLEFDISPVIATTDDESDDVIEDIAKKLNMRVTRGSSNDKLGRWMKACEQHSLSKFITIDCDDPFFDPVLTCNIYNNLSEKLHTILPDMRAYLGSHNLGMTYHALCLVVEHVQKNNIHDTENVKALIAETPNMSFMTAQIDKVDPVEKNLRLTLDYEEDYWLIRTVIRELGPIVRRHDIVEYFRNNSALRRVNEFRNEEWLRRQQG